MRLVVLVSVAVLALGCAAKRSIEGAWLPGQELQPGASILIVPVEDGVEREDGPAHGSGAAVTAAIRDKLLARGFPPRLAESTSVSDALTEASELQLVYVLKGVITEWEDNATAWSGKPDRAALSVELHDVESGEMVAAAHYRVASPAATLTSKQPDRFIPEIVDNALARLLKWTPELR
jgi:hypothetical protein